MKLFEQQRFAASKWLIIFLVALGSFAMAGQALAVCGAKVGECTEKYLLTGTPYYSASKWWWQCKFFGITLTCTAGSGCGNGMIETGETCDSTNLNSKTCLTQGFTGGTLACAANCRSFVTTSCTSGTPPPPPREVPVCGDGKITNPEQCDGTLLNSDCMSMTGKAGTLACYAKGTPNQCTYDFTNCPKCGDGIKNGTEQCDGPDASGGLVGLTCAGVNKYFDSGTLSCNSDCTLNTGTCVASTPPPTLQGNDDCKEFTTSTPATGDFVKPCYGCGEAVNILHDKQPTTNLCSRFGSDGQAGASAMTEERNAANQFIGWKWTCGTKTCRAYAAPKCEQLFASSFDEVGECNIKQTGWGFYSSWTAYNSAVYDRYSYYDNDIIRKDANLNCEVGTVVVDPGYKNNQTLNQYCADSKWDSKYNKAWGCQVTVGNITSTTYCGAGWAGTPRCGTDNGKKYVGSNRDGVEVKGGVIEEGHPADPNGVFDELRISLWDSEFWKNTPVNDRLCLGTDVVDYGSLKEYQSSDGRWYWLGFDFNWKCKWSGSVKVGGVTQLRESISGYGADCKKSIDAGENYKDSLNAGVLDDGTHYSDWNYFKHDGQCGSMMYASDYDLTAFAAEFIDKLAYGGAYTAKKFDTRLCTQQSGYAKNMKYDKDKGEISWTCEGIPTPSRDKSCSRKLKAVCGTAVNDGFNSLEEAKAAKNLCLFGDVIDLREFPGDNKPFYTWDCADKGNHNNKVQCRNNRCGANDGKVVNQAKINNASLLCPSGATATITHNPAGSSGDYWAWQCKYNNAVNTTCTASQLGCRSFGDEFVGQWMAWADANSVCSYGKYSTKPKIISGKWQWDCLGDDIVDKVSCQANVSSCGDASGKQMRQDWLEGRFKANPAPGACSDGSQPTNVKWYDKNGADSIANNAYSVTWYCGAGPNCSADVLRCGTATGMDLTESTIIQYKDSNIAFFCDKNVVKDKTVNRISVPLIKDEWSWTCQGSGAASNSLICTANVLECVDQFSIGKNDFKKPYNDNDTTTSKLCTRGWSSDTYLGIANNPHVKRIDVLPVKNKWNWQCMDTLGGKDFCQVSCPNCN